MTSEKRNTEKPAHAGSASSPTPADQPVRVTPDNFVRAETDLYFSRVVAGGGFGEFVHFRDVTPVDDQHVVRMNRDTLYSGAVFDVGAGPVTVTLPDPGTRFMSAQILTEDHYVADVFYGPGRRTITRDDVETRYVMVAVRTLINPDDAADVRAVHALQDALTVEREALGTFEIPDWDPESQKAVRDALIQLGATLPDSKCMFGTKTTTEPVRRLVGAAAAWGGNPDDEALYLNVTPPDNDGVTVYRLTIRDVPVDGFWSVTVYNEHGYLIPNQRNAHSLNSITAAADSDGGVVIQFGGCDGEAPDCLPIAPGWNYLVRLFRPRPEVVNGTWTFPEPERLP
jgi:hypothetical protein